MSISFFVSSMIGFPSNPAAARRNQEALMAAATQESVQLSNAESPVDKVLNELNATPQAEPMPDFIAALEWNWWIFCIVQLVTLLLFKPSTAWAVASALIFSLAVYLLGAHYLAIANVVSVLAYLLLRMFFRQEGRSNTVKGSHG